MKPLSLVAEKFLPGAGSGAINLTLKRYGAAVLLAALAGCGGGGGASTGGGSLPVAPVPPPVEPYSNVQPPAAPAPEAVNLAQASGSVSVSPDTFNQAGLQPGVLVELHAILADGSLGPVRASATTGASGSFTMVMPASTSTSDGSWMLVARPAGTTLRAYLHSGPVRVDVSSEAWVRQVAASAGGLKAFPNSMATLKGIVRSIALFSDSTGADYAGQSLGAAADGVNQALAGDHAMAWVRSSLSAGGTLPAAGTGDIGAFYALSDSYAGEFVDGAGAKVILTTRSQSSGAPMGADGTWRLRAQFNSVATNSEIVGQSSDDRLTPDRWYTHLTGDGQSLIYLANAVGEFPIQSFPLQPGARQLDSRRIAKTGLNFTGGTDEQPMSFAVTETVGGVELVSTKAGEFRALRVVTETQLGLPKVDGSVSRMTIRETKWVAPGAGLIKEVDDALFDGVPQPDLSDSHELATAYAGSTVWPGRVTLHRDLFRAIAPAHNCAVALPELRRVVALDSAQPGSNPPHIGLTLWDMDTGAQIGIMRTFAGSWSSCPIHAAGLGTVVVTETFPERNLMTIWPADRDTAFGWSDVLHQVSGADLSDLASYRIAPIPDAADPARFHPAWVDAVFPSPDQRGNMLVGSVKSTYQQTYGSIPQYVQAIGPGVLSPVANLGPVLLVGADMERGPLFTSKNSGAMTLSGVPFNLSGANPAAAQVIRENKFVPQVWYASATYIHLPDGSSIRKSDGADGPQLPFTSESCGVGSGVLVCLDRVNDRLVRYDPDSLQVSGVAPLGSRLRAWARVEPDYSIPGSLLGIGVWDASTFQVGDYDVHVGRWQ